MAGWSRYTHSNRSGIMSTYLEKMRHEEATARPAHEYGGQSGWNNAHKSEIKDGVRWALQQRTVSEYRWVMES